VLTGCILTGTGVLDLVACPVPEPALAGMAPGGVIFALADPDPEVHPAVAAFPGIFRGALDSGARRITENVGGGRQGDCWG